MTSGPGLRIYPQVVEEAAGSGTGRGPRRRSSLSGLGARKLNASPRGTADAGQQGKENGTASHARGKDPTPAAQSTKVFHPLYHHAFHIGRLSVCLFGWVCLAVCYVRSFTFLCV